MVDLYPVDSTSIEAIGYDPGSRELHVRFLQSGRTYAYFDVDETVYEEFRQAPSIGQFFNANIKGVYDYGEC